jgi:hypothetical protein
MINIVKLVTGEELIGTVDFTSEHIVITNPCMLQVVPSRNNPEQPTMGIFPYASYTKNHKIKISNDFVVWREEPIQELYNQYNTIFGSGLLVADSSNVVDFNKFK